jgi:hypothetical protein
MRMAMLTIIATLGAATLIGPAKAAALMDTPTANSPSQTAAPTAACPTG